MAKLKLRKAEFIKDHVFFLNGAKRSINAEQMKKAKKSFNLPDNMWRAFAVNGIIKATKKQVESIKKAQADEKRTGNKSSK